MVVDYERHIVLAGPFHEGVENQEQRVVVEFQFCIGALNKCIAVCGVEVEVNRQAEALETIFSEDLDILFAQFKRLELAIGIFEPVGKVDALVEVLHGLFLQRIGHGDFCFGEGYGRNDRILDFHIRLVLFDLRGVLQINVIDEEGVGHDLALAAFCLEADGIEMLGVEDNFFAPAALDKILEADDSLFPGARCRHFGKMHVVVFDIGDFDVDFVCATLVPVGDSAKTAVCAIFGNFQAPAYIRIVFVFASVESVVDLQGVVGTVVDTARHVVAVVVERSHDRGCTAVVLIVVGVPEIAKLAFVIGIFKVVH